MAASEIQGIVVYQIGRPWAVKKLVMQFPLKNSLPLAEANGIMVKIKGFSQKI
jgi:hypothetical protein